jgi:AraC-like DNA-binding protein
MCSKPLIIMYDQIREDTVFIMLYAVVTAMTAIASFYLLFRRGNAFAPDITPPVRLRRWTAAFLAVSALAHVWYMPIFFLSSNEDILLCDLIGGLLDSMTCFPLAMVVLFTMLQDRRRPLWPIAVLFAPLIAGMVWSVATRSEALLPVLFAYFALVCIGLIVYMACAVRQYGRWLRDNYADLEHKEVWQSFVVLAVMLLLFVFYSLTGEGPFYVYVLLVISAVLVCYLLWRVETLSDLSTPIQSDAAIAVDDYSLSIRNNIGSLLKQHCEETQLYLQHDITLSQLAKLVGTNRSYLSKHFAAQGITYNAYINALRIQHFVNLCHERVAAHQSLPVQQMALESGFRSYSTFYTAFKQVMGTTATEWMRNIAE